MTKKEAPTPRVTIIYRPAGAADERARRARLWQILKGLNRADEASEEEAQVRE